MYKVNVKQVTTRIRQMHTPIRQTQNMSFPKALADYMSRTDIDQGGLAHALDVSQGTISRWLSGSAYPAKAMWPQLAELLGVTAEQIGAWQAKPTMAERVRLLESTLSPATSSGQGEVSAPVEARVSTLEVEFAAIRREVAEVVAEVRALRARVD